MKNALILVDIQNNYFPNGKMELVNMTKAAVVARQLLEKFRKTAALVIHIQHISLHDGATFFCQTLVGRK